ncbi:SUMF1/EgtB/PvdO family nonheme iron enzyme [Candidatus Fermentibacteria bacterium]|nr:SUMF1/EgtB/PvdO family nonheme iron enzyme [Candidatus Fermentibacteria bacterium]
MHGSRWEWFWDWYGLDASRFESDLVGSSLVRERIHRGGAWDDLTQDRRSASRGGNDPGLQGIGLGFRG